MSSTWGWVWRPQKLDQGAVPLAVSRKAIRAQPDQEYPIYLPKLGFKIQDTSFRQNLELLPMTSTIVTKKTVCGLKNCPTTRLHLTTNLEYI